MTRLDTPPKDFSGEVAPVHSAGGRLGFLLLGHFCVALGVIGLFLPVMPTTVFLLGAAACYARASAPLYNRLLNSRMFGPVIADWRHHRAMTARAKTLAIGFVALGIGATVLLGVETLWLRIVLIAIAIGVSGFLLSIKTRRPGRPRPSRRARSSR
jgi:uncharacterized membrane protein YbaN (DUF454 family)